VDPYRLQKEDPMTNAIRTIEEATIDRSVDSLADHDELLIEMLTDDLTRTVGRGDAREYAQVIERHEREQELLDDQSVEPAGSHGRLLGGR
jgi:hypothetical protein